MSKFISISTRILGIAFLGMTALQASAHAGSLDERFHTTLNQEIVKVKNMTNAEDKREELGQFLKRIDAALGNAKNMVSEKDATVLVDLQQKLETDYTQLNSTVSDGELNHFANFVQQDMEQANGVYISAFGLILILIILLIVL